MLQPEFGTHDLAKQSAEFDMVERFNQSLERVDLAKVSAEIDFWISLQPEFGTCDLA